MILGEMQTMSKRIGGSIICLLLIGLFVYGAAIKLADYDIYKARLAESPGIAPFSNTLAWIVPVCELVIASLLLLKVSRLTGLFSSFVFLFLLTIYLMLLSWFNLQGPCPCGGFPESLSWQTHILFNCSLLFLNAIGIAWEVKH